ncbi:MAG: glycerophosphodiester phosphodiesterase [Thermoflavifilum sp.]|nr:glycerophosphodiester phosphodiesterase [Thermoflavifilum sp.]MCL6514426.1 glycerophosphodiester phosphodiesterase [Alicyclobacillus sp.]
MRRRFSLVSPGARVILAHRGANRKAPMNTLPAFAQAMADGADALELDIHWTRDGVIVVSHDETVDACSNGSGRIQDMTFAALRALDFGYRFTPDGGRSFPWRGRGVVMPTLREVLAAFPAVPVTIEVKPKRPPSLAQFLRELHELGALPRVLVASFHHGVLQRLRRMEPRLWTSASPREAACFLAHAQAGRTPRRLPFAALQVPPRLRGLPVLRPRVLEAAHRARIPVHVWTVDDEAEMRRWWQAGVDGMVTNEPDVACRIRDEQIQGPSVKEA